MHRADAGAGEHRIGRFRDHRYVDGDAITLLDAVLLQHIRHAADMLVELVIGDLLVDIGLSPSKMTAVRLPFVFR